ncbi:mechanosensitive ion channel protein 10-like isoform X2 [Tripterygium wilfordii]|uniref:mechanosensitive ion channel protein 10-like isoform X2 n=1 Tax=Tripterygium wilfordii TaxID=458696 RepID=UPI0018F83D05|nr:mechanosensitive ion channel protein 10-like isoform X2 [Tripterygium wilfordii]
MHSFHKGVCGNGTLAFHINSVHRGHASTQVTGQEVVQCQRVNPGTSKQMKSFMEKKAFMEGVRGKKEMNDVVLQISSREEVFHTNNGIRGSTTASAVTGSSSHPISSSSQLGSSPEGSNLELVELENLKCSVQTPPSSERAQLSPAPKMPPKISTDTLTRRTSLARSEFSKPKSRFIEPPYPKNTSLVEEQTHLENSSSSYRDSSNAASPRNKVSATTTKENIKSAALIRKTSLIGSPGGDDEDDEVYETASLEASKNKGKKWTVLLLIELIVFVSFTGILIMSLTVDRLQNSMIWGLELWKWCVLVSVVFCGRLVTGWLMYVLVLLIERNFLLRNKVLYFVYGLKRSVQVFIWLGLVLLAWFVLFTLGVERSKETTKILNHVTRALAGCLIGAAIWVVKTFLIKLLASSFHVTRFFDRIQESIFHQYVLRTLSGPPLMEMAEGVGNTATIPVVLSLTNLKKKDWKSKEIVNIDKLKRMTPETISAWTMRGLTNVISGSGLSTLSHTLDQIVDVDEGENKDKEITSEWEAKAAAYRIFQNVAKPGSKYIDEEDLLRFIKKEEVDNVLLLFEGAAETRKIKRKALKNWLVKVYLERKSLAHSLNDTKTAIEELNKLLSGVLLMVITIVWCLLMGFLTTKALVFISSQLLLVVFMFGNTVKTVFEAIIFVFIMHPFDVGDRCVIDGVQMVVEEMNILTTVFLRFDNEKIFYPNSVLATKPISNFYRSPEMSDSVEFAVDVSTSIEVIGSLKARIKVYLESKSQHWRPNHCIVVKEIENVNKMKMTLYVNHTINFQNYTDRNNRRSELVLELKKIFEELGIKFHLLPQEVQLRHAGSAASEFPLPTR